MDQASKKPIILGVFVRVVGQRALLNGITSYKMYNMLQLLAEKAEEANITVVLYTLRNISIEDEQIEDGVYWDKGSQSWRVGNFTLPNIIYEVNRIYGKKYNRVMKMFSDKNIIVTNPFRVFNKLDVHDILKKNPITAKYLPSTSKVNRFSDIRRFLKKYDVIYLKKTVSSLSKGVFRVKKLDNRKFQISYLTERQHSQTVTFIKPHIKRFFKNKMYIVQEGINLISIDGQNIDFRAEVQRNGQNQIDILGIAARIGKKGSPITIGSEAMSLERFFSEKMHYNSRQIDAMLLNANVFLMKIYQELEKEYGNIADIGIDFGFDLDNNIWLIEPNARSKKVSFYLAYGQEGILKFTRNLLGYIDFLLEQNITS